ncbi:hypothetical protein H4Q26_008337 [Puccinia striiformis f. sp. tritici PST-130]|nr:hypothetical protein H4Q26_008337 [Puccinia striiformis f. sp. tritici PST-130]
MQLFTASTTPTQPLGLLPLANQIISQSVQYHRLISLFCHHPVTTPLHVLLVLNTGIAHHNDHPNVDPPSLNQDNDNQINTDRVNVDPSLANPGTNAIIDPALLPLPSSRTNSRTTTSVRSGPGTLTVAIQEQLTTDNVRALGGRAETHTIIGDHSDQDSIAIITG